MTPSITEFINSIITTSAYFSIIEINDLQELKIRTRKIFNQTLSIDAVALYATRERDNYNTSQEQRGFYQILEDYSIVNDLLAIIKNNSFFLKILKPLVYIFGIIIFLMIAFVITGTLQKLSLIMPFFKNTHTIPWIFGIFAILFIIMIIFSVLLKTWGMIALDKINMILMEYDPDGEFPHIKTINLSPEEKDKIQKSKEEL